MKRIFDFTLAIFLLCFFGMPMVIIAVLIRVTSKGPVLYWSDRVGRNNKLFKMPKFRTMISETPAVATHLLEKPEIYLTSIGYMLRKYSLDELPQLLSVIKGDMSFVGPRPALFNQDDLISLRTQKGIERLIPGITGWAQINGRDQLLIPDKVHYDEYYLLNQCFLLDVKIIMLTFLKVINGDGVTH